MLMEMGDAEAETVRISNVQIIRESELTKIKEEAAVEKEKRLSQ